MKITKFQDVAVRLYKFESDLSDTAGDIEVVEEERGVPLRVLFCVRFVDDAVGIDLVAISVTRRHLHFLRDLQHAVAATPILLHPLLLLSPLLLPLQISLTALVLLSRHRPPSCRRMNAATDGCSPEKQSWSNILNATVMMLVVTFMIRGAAEGIAFTNRSQKKGSRDQYDNETTLQITVTCRRTLSCDLGRGRPFQVVED